MDFEKAFDYVIVGGGAAGCVLARRLIENTDSRVLLLEAGGSDERETISRTDVMSMLSLWGADDEATWNYATTPQPRLEDRVVQIPQGRTLGGGSSVNAMMYVRGNRRDFDHWAHLGNEGWSYQEVLPYFKKIEDFEGGESEYRGAGGPLSVTYYQDPAPVSQAFLDAAVELGYSAGGDYNGETQENTAFFYQTSRTKDRYRSSTATAYLRPVVDHPDLTVLTGAKATRIVLEGSRAVGVEYLHEGTTHLVRAGVEVILSAGAVATPQLLMLSGIGPADELREHGITPLVDLPGVGKNLQDHLLFGLNYDCLTDQPPPQLLAEAGIFVYTRQPLPAASPEIQFIFGPMEIVSGEFRLGGPEFSFTPILMQPQSRGTVTLRSADPADLPLIDPHYLENPADLEVLVRSVGIARQFANSKAFAGLKAREVSPGDGMNDHRDLERYIRSSASTMWHPVGTCRMGTDEDSVVNSRLQPHGVDGLRIVDASIMPTITAGNTNAPSIMIAEKGADLISAGVRPRQSQ